MQGNDAYRLIVRRGPQPNQVYELTGEVSNLGRDITNDIVINDREASRHHMRLMRGMDGYTVEDLGSTNGTFVNGKRVTGVTPLKNGDMIGLGETVTLQFEVVRPGAVQAAPSSPAAQPTAPSAINGDPFRPQPQENPYQPQPAARQPAPQPAPESMQPSDAYYGSAAPQAAAYGPPPPGYDYDPYAMREEEGSSPIQWFLIGCLGLVLLCCCMTVVLAVAIDSFCWYNQVPGLMQILSAIGLSPSC